MILSIITPSYNPGAMLAEAVESLSEAVKLIQARHPEITVEQVIMDDGSTDDATEAAYALIAERYPFCRVERDDLRQQGPASARNRAIARAKGDWIGFLDADDHFHPEGLAALVDTVVSHQDAQWAIADTMHFDGDGRETLRRLRCAELVPHGEDRPVYVDSDALRAILAGPPSLFLGSMIVRKDLFLKAGGFDEDLLFGEDWFLTLSLTLETGAYYAPIHVERLRRAHASLTQSSLSLTSRRFKATLKAMRDRRFASVRKVLRWTLKSQLVNVRDACSAAGLRWRALRYALLAWCTAPEEPRLLVQAAGLLLPQKRAS